MNITKAKFGIIQGQEVDIYTLRNDNGVEINISNYGATITSIILPNKLGELENIACGFDELQGYFSEEYKANAPYFGCTVGRYCSQIKDSKFSLNGTDYDLAKNCGENNLHGGVVGFDKKIWEASIIDSADSAGVSMSILSKDLEEGFPGDVKITVTFSLNNHNELSINYSATPDQDTPLALTNHTYFNLSGFKSSIEDHKVKILAGQKLKMDETGAALGEIENLDDKIDDLRNETSIRACT